VIVRRPMIPEPIHMYGTLLDIDLLHCVRLFGDDPDALLGDDGAPAFVQPRNCT